MRSSAANALAILVYIFVIWVCFATVVSFAADPHASMGFTVRFERGSFTFATIFMVLVAPIAFCVMLLYYIAFQARGYAILVLAAAAILLSVAGMSPILKWLGDPDSNHNARHWVMIVWAGVVAALAHHLVIAATIGPRSGPSN